MQRIINREGDGLEILLQRPFCDLDPLGSVLSGPRRKEVESIVKDWANELPVLEETQTEAPEPMTSVSDLFSIAQERGWALSDLEAAIGAFEQKEEVKVTVNAVIDALIELPDTRSENPALTTWLAGYKASLEQRKLSASLLRVYQLSIERTGLIHG